MVSEEKMNQFPTPAKLQVNSQNATNNWLTFKQMWQNYEIATGLSVEEEAKRRATLLMIIGEEALQIYNSFQWETREDGTEEEKTVEKIIKKFDKYFNPKRNITFERFKLMSRKQKVNETSDEYLTVLHNLAANCNYGGLKEEITLDVFILGLYDRKIQEQLLKQADLKLETALNIARAAEVAQSQVQLLNKNSESEDTVFLTQRKTDKSRSCYACGRQHERIKQKCPAYGKQCNKCKAFNHFANVCKTKIKKFSFVENSPIQEKSEDEESAEE